MDIEEELTSEEWCKEGEIPTLTPEEIKRRIERAEANQPHYCCEPISASIIAAAVTHKILEKMEKKFEEGMDKRDQLENLLFKMENENDTETYRGMRSAYYELCAKYDIYDAKAREHKRRMSCFCF